MRALLLLLPLLAAATADAQPLAFTSPNPESDGGFGDAISVVPDANGDGRDDVLVGAPGENRAYLYSGATGAILRTLTGPNGVGFGASVSGVEDADGDGRGDLLIGAYGENRAYLYGGATGALLRTLFGPNGSRFGWSVSGVPDADGDGRGDLLIGAPGEDVDGWDYAGRARLYSGASGALLYVFESDSPFEFYSFGWSVSGVPDVNGDGRGDLLVGSERESRAYVYSGASGARLRMLSSPNQPYQRYFGYSVSGLPDVNGDGRGDLLVSDPSELEADESITAGRAYTFSGATGQLLQTFTPPTPEEDGSFGDSVSGVPDVDGDGRVDVLIGAPGESPGGLERAGRAYAFSGATGQRLYSLRSPNPEDGARYGVSVVGMPDVNGDGLGDGVVGAQFEDGGGVEYAGRVYLYRTSGADGSWATDDEVAIAALATGGPAALALSVAPNPLASATTVRVSLPHPSEATAEMLDVLGRRVALLYEGALSAGTHEVRWAPAAGLPGGVYLLRLRAEGAPSITRRVTLAR